MFSWHRTPGCSYYLLEPKSPRRCGAHHGASEPARGRQSRRRNDRTLVEPVQAEYAEMPGLSVTLPQAQRLWAVDQATCEEVFRRLIARGLLRLTARGRFVRA